MSVKSYYGKIQAAISSILNSIGFIPFIMSACFLVAGIVLVSAEIPSIERAVNSIPLLRVKDIETVRAIFTSYFAGIISILIFSFSMVMIVLNQTSTQYSPRILNWLIGKRTNQWILGTYLGTLILTLILLISLPSSSSEVKPFYSVAVLLDSILVFICLILFITIINTVSQDLQVSNIIQNIYLSTQKRMKREKDHSAANEEDKVPREWHPYPVVASGYLQHIGQRGLLTIVRENNLKIKISWKAGRYYLLGDPLFYLDKKDVDEQLVQKITAQFVFYQGNRIEDNSFYGFKQLSEIAIKALSPGINDPRTANNCLDYMTDLAIEWMTISTNRIIRDKEGTPRIYIFPYTFLDLLDLCFAPILLYGRKDVNILQSLLVFVKKLTDRDKEQKYAQELKEFFLAITAEFEQHKSNPYFHRYLQEEKSEQQIPATG